MFSLYDLEQLSQAGISEQQALQQIDNFRIGFPFLPIEAAATPAKGIVQYSQEQQDELVKCFDNWGGSRLKFVPASGAATRMFKSLYETQTQLAANPQSEINDKDSIDFFAHLPYFAFYETLSKVNGFQKDNKLSVLNALLNESGLNYGNLPKGLLIFHKYDNEVRTAFEEHLVEAALYAKDAYKIARLHFTVSPEHRAKFEALTEKILPEYEKKYSVKFEIIFSEQKKSTDIIAVDERNEPFRNADGSLLFRPGGHGALLENLNEINADIIFIKNIDNVVTDTHKAATIHWKKVLAGALLQLREQIHNYIELIEKYPEPIKLREIAQFLETTFSITLPKVSAQEYAPLLHAMLDRPLRVCGMVKNVGEPGGGPFIARNPSGSSSLQIVESSQLDLQNPEIKNMFNAATHFNPVDLVCSFRNYKGGMYDLRKFRDSATGFISLKSKDGKTLKAQELPGLWNGAMSNWNTLFVEVPLITFNPVKTVNDLLRQEHQ